MALKGASSCDFQQVVRGSFFVFIKNAHMIKLKLKDVQEKAKESTDMQLLDRFKLLESTNKKNKLLLLPAGRKPTCKQSKTECWKETADEN
jgi:hypothetical protein